MSKKDLKLVAIIIVSIIIAAALINGIVAAAGDGTGPLNSSDDDYKIVLCADHPEAIGC